MKGFDLVSLLACGESPSRWTISISHTIINVLYLLRHEVTGKCPSYLHIFILIIYATSDATYRHMILLSRNLNLEDKCYTVDTS